MKASNIESTKHTLVDFAGNPFYSEFGNSYFKLQQFYRTGFRLKTKYFALTYGVDSLGPHLRIIFRKLTIGYRFGNKVDNSNLLLK